MWYLNIKIFVIFKYILYPNIKYLWYLNIFLMTISHYYPDFCFMNNWFLLINIFDVIQWKRSVWQPVSKFVPNLKIGLDPDHRFGWSIRRPRMFDCRLLHLYGNAVRDISSEIWVKFSSLLFFTQKSCNFWDLLFILLQYMNGFCLPEAPGVA